MPDYYVYALRSKLRNYIYVGMTDNIERRTAQHNNGHEKTTRQYAPFELIYQERHPDRVSARKREKYLKGGSGKKFLHSIAKIPW